MEIEKETENKKTERKTGLKTIKANIKKQMCNRNINISALSKKTHINICILIFLLYFPFAKLRLTQTIKICKALKLKISDVFI